MFRRKRRISKMSASVAPPPQSYQFWLENVIFLLCFAFGDLWVAFSEFGKPGVADTRLSFFWCFIFIYFFLGFPVFLLFASVCTLLP
ncbi:hypothetical protein BGZ63DRAFT_396579 [Mariannaea sp. PMI_226]|nr:hypothetical protein BGZ63DRAFT_396579 [Mariannaea sp. PMI_226]